MSAQPVLIDTDNMYTTGAGAEGIARQDLERLQPRLRAVQDEVDRDSKGGLDAVYACLNLGREMQAMLDDVEDMAAEIRTFRDVVVVGIGGSSLGAKSVWHALRKRPYSPCWLHFVENVDPFDLNQLLLRLDAETTAVICISKSGGTIETVVQYLVLRDWLTRHLGARARRHQWIVTDPEQGWLRELARKEGLPSLPVPPKVGGRYSVLTAVGLLPLAVIGADVGLLLEGAADNADRCKGSNPEQNRALEMAALYFLLDRTRGKRVSVMMPYVNRLRLFVDWYCQLWAESLGKHTGDGQEPAGTLPVRAMGAVDQHSQLQMYLESRHDKMFTFIELAQWEQDVAIPLSADDATQFPYLHSRSLAEVIDAEFNATRQTITDAGHPNMTLRLPSLDTHVLGQLIDLYQRVTVYTARLYGVNPLDQPAVERGKKLAVQYLSR